jgi:hypothetical protein
MAISIPRNPRLDKRHSLFRGLIFDCPFVHGAYKGIDLVTGIRGVANANLGSQSGKYSGQTPDFNQPTGGMAWIHPLLGAHQYISAQIIYLRKSGGSGTGYGNLLRYYDSVNDTQWFGVENDNWDSGWGQRVNVFYTDREKVWSTPYPTNNIWHNYIITYDHTNKDNVPRVWDNGVALELTNRWDAGWTKIIVPNTIYIGRALIGGGWDGGILLVRAWKRIISDKEIGLLMADPTILYKKRSFFSFSNVPSGLSLINISDTGSGADAPTIQAAIPLSDTGSGTDTLTNAVSVPLADTGSGVDTFSVSASIPVSDSGTGSDLLSLLANISVSDTGSGVDALSLLAQIAVSDTGTSAEALAILASIVLSDTGTGADQVTVIPSILVVESGNGVDDVYVSSFVAVTDSGSGVETLYIIANVAISDSGNAVEAVFLLTYIAINDTGLANDALDVLASISISDIGLGVDQLFNAVTIGLSDNGSGNDVLSILLNVFVSDTGVGVDEILRRISETLGKFRGMLQYKSKTLALGKKLVKTTITRK